VRHIHILIFLAALLLIGCRPKVTPDPCPAIAWGKEPLQPQLHFDQPGPAGVVIVLVLDAHSGASLLDAVVVLTDTPRTARTDSSGTATLRDVPPGRYEVRALRLGYSASSDSLVLASGEGRVRIIQLQRVGFCLEETVSD